LQEAIRQILESIQAGLIFDSNLVIDQFIKGPTHIYLAFARANPSLNVAPLHSRISTIIGEQSDLVQRNGQSWSTNIHGRVNDCAAWIRI